MRGVTFAMVWRSVSQLRAATVSSQAAAYATGNSVQSLTRAAQWPPIAACSRSVAGRDGMRATTPATATWAQLQRQGNAGVDIAGSQAKRAVHAVCAV